MEGSIYLLKLQLCELGGASIPELQSWSIAGKILNSFVTGVLARTTAPAAAIVRNTSFPPREAANRPGGTFRADGGQMVNQGLRDSGVAQIRVRARRATSSRQSRK